MSDPIVGIDLGTSNTVVAHAEGEGMATVLADANGFKIHPSVVSFHPSGGVVVGAAAKQRKVIDPKNTIYSVKRLIGRAFNSKEVQEAKRRAPFTIKEGANQLPLVVTRGGEFAIPEISAIVLDHAKNVASQALQTDVSRAVVTVPASFNDAQRSATATAGSIAGLSVVRVLNEPTAAALAYGHSRNLNETIAVYDFGGGTFDITILKLQDQVYEVLGTSGDSFLGGDDLDERIVDRMVDKFLAEHRVDLRTNEVSMMRLRAVAEQTKIELSRRSRAVVRVDEIAYGAKGKPLDLQIEIRREEFVSQVVDIIDKTFPVCAEAMKLAGLSVDQIDDVILVGGTTKIPYVRDMVTKFFNKAPRTDVSPEDAVALGAGLQATALERILKRKTPSTSVVEGIPKPIGVPEDEDEDFDSLGGETNIYGRDELNLGDEDTFTKPEPGAAKRPVVGDRPVERGKQIDIYQDRPPQPPPSAPAGPVIGRIATKNIQPPPGAKTALGIATQPPPPTPQRSTAPRTAQRPPAVPSAPPQAKTMILEPTPIAQQSTVIIDQDALNPGSTQRDLSPASTAPGMGKAGRKDDHLDLDMPLPGRRGDEHLDLDDDIGFPNLTTDKGFVDLDFPPSATAKGMQPSSTARGMPTPPPPAPTRNMPAQPPGTTARGMPTPPAPAPTRNMPVAPQTFPVMPETAPFAGPGSSADPFAPPASSPYAASADPFAPPSSPAAPPSPSGFGPYAPPATPYTPPASSFASAGAGRSPVVLDVTPRGLGIATVAGFCEELIRRNSRVPTEMKKMFSTSRDDQDIVRIVVVQGESRRMQQNTAIADLTLTGLQRRPRGETTIEVTFMIDANGILNVRARDAQTGREERASLDIIGSIAEGDVSASREKLQALRR